MVNSQNLPSNEDLQLSDFQQQSNNNFQSNYFDLTHNNSVLINKLEKIANGLGGGGFENFLNGRVKDAIETNLDNNNNNNNPLIQRHGMSDAEYSRFVSDIWIGVILTLLIISIIFFICSCFLYHKFQQWKNSYRTSNAEQSEIIRRLDLDMESLPSYTIVSGLPTYDDALEEFRKAGIILTPNVPMVKLFDNSGKETVLESNTDGDPNNMDNISTNSVCTCGASNTNLSTAGLTVPTTITNPNQQVIELNPEQLRQLSQKRLSLQINFTPPRRNSRPRIDLYREVSRNNMLRALGGGDFPEIHRSASVMTLNNERSLLEQRLRHLQHRGSLT